MMGCSGRLAVSCPLGPHAGENLRVLRPFLVSSPMHVIHRLNHLYPIRYTAFGLAVAGAVFSILALLAIPRLSYQPFPSSE